MGALTVTIYTFDLEPGIRWHVPGCRLKKLSNLNLCWLSYIVARDAQEWIEFHFISARKLPLGMAHAHRDIRNKQLFIFVFIASDHRVCVCRARASPVSCFNKSHYWIAIWFGCVCWWHRLNKQRHRESNRILNRWARKLQIGFRCMWAAWGVCVLMPLHLHFPEPNWVWTSSTFCVGTNFIVNAALNCMALALLCALQFFKTNGSSGYCA